MKLNRPGKQLIAGNLAIAAAIITSGSLGAATMFDTSLVSPGADAPGWYDGTVVGPNGGFTVTTTDGIEIGLRAKLREDPNLINPVGDLYIVPTGSEQQSVYHNANPNRAAWSFEFSVDLGAGGTGIYNWSNTTSTLTIMDLTGTGGTQIFNTLFGDNSEFGTSGIVHQNNGPDQSLQWGTQNSENPSFFPTLFNDINSPHTYQFDLSVTTSAGVLLATDTMLVSSVVPEPGTLGLIGLGLAGLAAVAGRVRGMSQAIEKRP